jgi:hypothetical protein
MNQRLGLRPALPLTILLTLALVGCSAATTPAATPTPVPPADTPAPGDTLTPSPAPGSTDAQPSEETAGNSAPKADVLSVSVSGEEGAYTFSVEVASPDEGCDQYADWWEVVSADGELHYRRILLHSHTDEQPFTRSGGPVPVGAEETVMVRAHMAPGGYGGQVMEGSVANGFTARPGDADFAAGLEMSQPLPEDCAF